MNVQLKDSSGQENLYPIVRASDILISGFNTISDTNYGMYMILDDKMIVSGTLVIDTTKPDRFRKTEGGFKRWGESLYDCGYYWDGEKAKYGYFPKSFASSPWLTATIGGGYAGMITQVGSNKDGITHIYIARPDLAGSASNFNLVIHYIAIGGIA